MKMEKGPEGVPAKPAELKPINSMSTASPTILGGPIPDELRAKWEKERQINEKRDDRAGALMELLLEGYQSGELGLEQYARLVHRAIRCNTPDRPNTQARWLGEAIAAALASDRKNRGRGNKGAPQCIRAAALEILESVVRREKLPLTRGPDGAFVKCCEIFAEAGYPGISPTELEKWRNDANRSARVIE